MEANWPCCGRGRSQTPQGTNKKKVPPHLTGRTQHRSDWIVPSYTTRLCSRESNSSDLLLVQLEKPAGFQFQAGQFAELWLIESPVLNLGETFRTFSFVSAPCDLSLEFTMRLSSSAFKTTLSTIPLGTKLLLKGPAGTLRLHSDKDRPAIFLAGGVGIAPFVSMLRQAAHDHLEHSFLMFYSTHSRSEMVYLEELSAPRSFQDGESAIDTDPDRRRRAGLGGRK